jgi:plasmid maintenance system antidote protein VapI
LEWVTSKENHVHAVETGLMPIGSARPGAKLTESTVEVIKEYMIAGADDQEVSEITGVVTATISKIRQGKRWAHVILDVEVPINSDGRKGNSRGKQKLSSGDIPAIRSLYQEGLSLAEIGRRFHVHSGTIDGIVKGKTWTNY